MPRTPQRRSRCTICHDAPADSHDQAIRLKGALSAQAAWLRVWPAHRWQNGLPAESIPDAAAAARWLLVEWRTDGTVKHALSNLPSDTPLEQTVAWWKERWPIERGYEQLKDELGLDTSRAAVGRASTTTPR